MIRFGSFLVMTATLLVAGCEKPAATLSEWREVSADDRSAAPVTEEFADRHPRLRDSARGDFNGDGRRDTFALMTQKEGDRVALYFFDGAGAAPVEVAPASNRSDLPRYGLFMLPKGAASDICKVYAMEAEFACEAEKGFDSPVLVYVQGKEPVSVIVWNGDKFEDWKVPIAQAHHLLAIS